MSSWGSDAASRGQWERGGGLRSNLPIRRVVSVSITTLSLMFCVASVASANSNFYWYGEGNSTCWQTGQPGAPFSACDGVGETFLNSSNPPRTLNAVPTLEANSASGDYCSYHGTGDSLTSTDEVNEGAWTGLSPPSPYGRWQEGDAREGHRTARGRSSC